MVQSLRTRLRLIFRREKECLEDAPPSYSERASTEVGQVIHFPGNPTSPPPQVIILAFENGQNHLVAQPSSFVVATALAHTLSPSLAGRSFHFELLASRTGIVVLHGSAWTAALERQRRLEEGGVPVVHVVQDPSAQGEVSNLSLLGHLSRRRSPAKRMRQVFVTGFEVRTMTIPVGRDTLVKGVKQVIFKKTGIPIEQQRLYYVCKLLTDSQPLQNYYIGERSTISPAYSTHIVSSGKHIGFRFLAQQDFDEAANLEIEPRADVVTRVFLLFEGVEVDEATGWTKPDEVDWAKEVGVEEEKVKDEGLFRVLEWDGTEFIR